MGCFASQPIGAVPVSDVEPRLEMYDHMPLQSAEERYHHTQPQSAESLPQSPDVSGWGNRSNFTGVPAALGESDD